MLMNSLTKTLGNRDRLFTGESDRRVRQRLFCGQSLFTVMRAVRQ